MQHQNASHQQNHPLYSIDRDHVDRLLSQNTPEDKDLVDLARLILRYQEFPGAEDIQRDLHKVLALWGLNKEQLNSKTREIWQEGFRPGEESSADVGSGFDTSDS